MQHYGLPTRLLDWTDSPLVATYFAAQDRNCQNEDAALWALCPKRLNHHQAQRKEILSPTEEPALSVIRGAFSDVPQVGEVAPPTDYNALAIRTPSIDIRMLTQLSRFTVHGLARALDSLDLRKAVPATGGIRRRPRRDHGTEPFLLKFPIDAKAKPDLPQWLYGLGIRRAGLFPDLQNLSAELRDLAGFGDSS